MQSCGSENKPAMETQTVGRVKAFVDRVDMACGDAGSSAAWKSPEVVSLLEGWMPGLLASSPVLGSGSRLPLGPQLWGVLGVLDSQTSSDVSSDGCGPFARPRQATEFRSARLWQPVPWQAV